MTNQVSSATLSIGEVAKRASIRPSALRYYESIGLLPAPKRVNGRRCYDETVLQRLALLQLAQKAGFTMSEIDELFHGFAVDTPPAERWQVMAHTKMTELDAVITRAQQMKALLEHGLRCNCLRLEECVIVMGRGCEVAMDNSCE
jgi:MerR family transcriptional regulator, redox-sensitive transcriptional activator SoxR